MPTYVQSMDNSVTHISVVLLQTGTKWDELWVEAEPKPQPASQELTDPHRRLCLYIDYHIICMA